MNAAGDPGSRRRFAVIALAAIVALALLIRLLHFAAIHGTAFPRFPLYFTDSDMHFYWEWAGRIAGGDWLSRDPVHPYPAWMARIAPLETWLRWWGGREILPTVPLYPYWVAALLRVSGGSVDSVILAQLFAGALQPIVLYWLGRRLFDERVGLVAAALDAVYGPAVFFQGTLLRDWMPPILEPLALVAILRARDAGRAGAWVAAGAALGLALLAKTSILLFLPWALLWTVLETRPPRRKAVLAAACLVLGVSLSLAPLLARNRLAGAPLLALDSRSGENVILGLAPDSFAVGLVHSPSLGILLDRSGGRFLPALRETLGAWQGDWRAFLRLQVLKLRALLDPIEVPDNLSFAYGLDLSPGLRWTLRWGGLVPLGLAGLVLSLPAWRRHGLLLLYGFAVLAVLLIPPVLGRYRLTLEPILCVYAGAGVVRAWESARERRVRSTAGFALLVVLVALVQHRLAPIRVLRESPAFVLRPQEYRVSARIYASEGRLDRATSEIARLRTQADALAAARPAFVARAAEAAVKEGDYRVLWARDLLARDRRKEALRQAEAAERLYGGQPMLAEPAVNLGLLYWDLGERARTAAYLRRFIALAPRDERAEDARRILAEIEGQP